MRRLPLFKFGLTECVLWDIAEMQLVLPKRGEHALD